MNVGDYVRTKNGNIRKIKEVIDKAYIDDPDYYVDKVLINIEQNRAEDTIYMEGWLFEEDVIKSSSNIIDLIEVGDYVDKLKVVDKYEDYIVVETFDERIVIDKEDSIKSIVTKEQFSQMEYKVGE